MMLARDQRRPVINVGPRRARIYHTARTAHLERSLQLEATDLLYGQKRYDFDEGIAKEASQRSRLQQVGDGHLAWTLLRRPYDGIEINEPIALESVRRSALALAAVALSDALRGQRTSIVTYAIGNVPLSELPRPRGKARLGRLLDERLAPRVWRRCDRVVFGTGAARDAYALSFGPPGADMLIMTVPPLPTPCSCPPPETNDGDEQRLLFLGDLSARKGFDTVVATWPAVRARLPAARLVIVGRGAMLEQAKALAAGDAAVSLMIDPPREDVHRQLRRASVVVLPSQPTSGWREQVGLPLVEGLAHGCTIVTTDETGIADWLRHHGHHTVPAHSSSTLLEDEIVAALERPQAPDDIYGSLPDRDGRLTADALMFEA